MRRGTAAGVFGRAGFNIPAGGKTGTTNDGMDVWFIGFTQDLVTGVWMGFDKKTRIKGDAQGGRLAAPAWTMMMKEVYSAPSRRWICDGIIQRRSTKAQGACNRVLSPDQCHPRVILPRKRAHGVRPAPRFRGGW